MWEWNAYWQAEHEESCVPSDGAGAAGIVGVWRTFFESLPPGSRILDLGTGNGSLAAVAAAAGKEQPFAIDAIDLAAIDPLRFLPARRDLLRPVRFHGRVAMECLPFDDDAFDAVVSQYGIEYSDAQRSVAEALRVLAPGGRLRLLVHAGGGVLSERCRLQSRQATDLLASRLFPELVDLLEKLHAAERGGGSASQDDALAAVQALKSVLDSLGQRFGGDPDTSLPDAVFAAVRRLPDLRSSLDHGTLMATAGHTRHLLEAQLRRLEAMQRAALDRQGAEALARRLRQLGMRDVRLAAAEADTGGHLLGWWLGAAA